MCMNRTSQAGRYEGFDQSQDRKAAEPGNTAFEDSPAPANEPESFASSVPETSMILKYKETFICLYSMYSKCFKGTSLNYLQHHRYL